MHKIYQRKTNVKTKFKTAGREKESKNRGERKEYKIIIRVLWSVMCRMV